MRERQCISARKSSSRTVVVKVVNFEFLVEHLSFRIAARTLRRRERCIALPFDYVVAEIKSSSKMGRSKLKKKLQQKKSTAKETEESTSTKVPIDNLPEKFLWMHVKSGTKIRNVLGYALKEFPSYNSIVWTGIGHSITKVISCAEIFKRKHEGLHQVTKLCYVSSEKSKEDITFEARLPEIHILLTKDIKDPTELGYQTPGDCGNVSKKEDATESKTNIITKSTDNVSCINKGQSLTMKKIGKRKGTNEPNKNAEPSPKKNKIS